LFLLFRYGAYSPDEIYSFEEIKDLLRYALVRGVRIIIEIDSPAHAGNGWQWGKASGYGDMAVCVDKGPWKKYCVQPPCGQLNPINTNTYKWLGKIYKDLINVLPKGEAFHMGGDEVSHIEIVLKYFNIIYCILYRLLLIAGILPLRSLIG